MIVNNQLSLLQIIEAEVVSDGYKVQDAKCNLMFNSQNQIQCKTISFYNSNVIIQNLNLFGSMAFYNSTVTILNSLMTRNESKKDFVLFADENSNVVASNLKIDSKSMNGIQIQNHSIGTFSNCEISNSLKGIIVQGQSKLVLLDTEIKNNQNIDGSECLNILDDSEIQIVGCKFQNSKSSAIVVTKSVVNISSSTFNEIGKNYFYIQNNSFFF